MSNPTSDKINDYIADHEQDIITYLWEQQKIDLLVLDALTVNEDLLAEVIRVIKADKELGTELNGFIEDEAMKRLYGG